MLLITYSNPNPLLVLTICEKFSSTLSSVALAWYILSHRMSGGFQLSEWLLFLWTNSLVLSFALRGLLGLVGHLGWRRKLSTYPWWWAASQLLSWRSVKHICQSPWGFLVIDYGPILWSLWTTWLLDSGSFLANNSLNSIECFRHHIFIMLGSTFAFNVVNMMYVLTFLINLRKS